jgi:hypothetical protein
VQGEKPNHTTTRKPVPLLSIQYSVDGPMHCCASRAYFGCALDLQGALAEVGVLNAQAQLSVPPYQQEFIYFTSVQQLKIRRSFLFFKKS